MLGLGGIIGGAAGAIGGLFGGLGKRKAIKKMMAQVNQQKKENQDWYDRRYNEDATQRADAQRILSMTEESIRNRNRQAAGSAAVMGGTDESVAAAKEANANALADAASRIAVAGEQRKDSIEGEYMDKKDRLDQQLMQLKGQKPGALDIANGAIGGAANGFEKGMDFIG